MARESAKTVEECLIVLKRTLEQGLTDTLAQTVSSLNHLEAKAEEHKAQLETVVNEARLSIETSSQQTADQIVATTGSHNAQLMAFLQQIVAGQQKHDSATLAVQRLIEGFKAPSIPPVMGRLSFLQIMDILHSSQHVPPNSSSNVPSSLLRMASDSYKHGNLQSVQLFLNEDEGHIMLKAFPSTITHYFLRLDYDFGEENFIMQLQTPFAHLICLLVTLEMRLIHRTAHSEWAMLDDSSLAKATAVRVMSAVYHFTLTMPPNTAAKIARKIWLGADKMGATDPTDSVSADSSRKLMFLFPWRDDVSTEDSYGWSAFFPVCSEIASERPPRRNTNPTKSVWVRIVEKASGIQRYRLVRSWAKDFGSWQALCAILTVVVAVAYQCFSLSTFRLETGRETRFGQPQKSKLQYVMGTFLWPAA